MEHIRSFIKIADGFYTSGQPTEAQLAEVQRRGVRAIFNLAMPDSDYALSDERAIVDSLGMEYVHIAVPFSSPTEEHFVQVEDELLSRREQPVLIHCALNWRASSFAAMFAERHFGWSQAQADELRSTLWSPNEIWNAWAGRIRALSAGYKLG